MSLNIILTLASILFGSGGIVAFVAWNRKQGKDSVIAEQDKERADVAEKRLDIANQPDADVVDISEWLSGDKK